MTTSALTTANAVLELEATAIADGDNGSGTKGSGEGRATTTKVGKATTAQDDHEEDERD